MAALRVKGLHKQFGNTHVLKGIDLTVRNGEFAVLLGPSGCGKSTLLNLIAGLEAPTAGTIEIAERVVNAVPAKDRDIAMVFQSYALYPSMTVRRNITFGFDFLLGLIPWVGAIPDFFFRSNTRNLRIIKRHLDKHHAGTATIEGAARPEN